MRPSSEINSVRVAQFEADEYTRVASYLRATNITNRRSYAPYVGSVYELDDRERSITFQDEQLLPRDDRRRPRLLFVVSNAHPESIRNGMFHTAESGIAELWLDLRDLRLLSGDVTTLASPTLLRELCLTVGYTGPFCLGFLCYWLFPTFHPDHLKALFGRDREPPGFQDTTERFRSSVDSWHPTAIVSLHGGVFESLTGEAIRGYTKRLRREAVSGEYRIDQTRIPVFQTYPAAWRYDREAERLRRESLARIVTALDHPADIPTARPEVEPHGTMTDPRLTAAGALLRPLKP